MTRRVPFFSGQDGLAHERFLYRPPSVHSIQLGAALIAPVPYVVAMGGLSLQAVWKSLLDTGAYLCDRAFSMYPTGAPLVPRLNLPDYELVGLSLPYELDWLAIPPLLEAGGLSVQAAERPDDTPIVLGGGASVTMNPEPLADILDAFVIGEVEPVIEGLTQVLLKHKGRAARLAALAELPGIYVPAYPSPEVVRRLVWNGVAMRPRSSLVLATGSVFGDRFLIEVGRGCPMGCQYCLARAIYHPVRYANTEAVLRSAEIGLQHTSRVGLIGSALTGYSELPALVRELVKRRAEVSLSSLRADRIVPELLHALRRGGQHTVTIAPEAGTERLRCHIGKAIKNDTFEQIFQACVEAGITGVKLYFMTGLPTETPTDREAIVETVTAWATRYDNLRFRVTLSPFIPKPWTPLEGALFPGEPASSEMLNQVVRPLQRRLQIDVRAASSRWSAVQAALARGDRSVGRALVHAARRGGSYAAVKQALGIEGIDLEKALTIPAEQPWRKALEVGEICSLSCSTKDEEMP
ncbi:MAG: B12-binding domain-containing radical SAM protein [Candidatus Zipacnadales bacterium]